jgi:IS5 family transposase
MPSRSTGPAAASTACRCEKGGELTGRNPTDRGKAGTKYHLLVDATGLVLHTLLSPANTHDSVLFEPLLETNPGVRGHQHLPGRPRRRPEKLHADKGYDYPRCRRYLHHRGIKVRIARRGIESSNHLGRVRWVVERSMCAARRSVVSPVQPGGIWREVPGSNG